MNDKLWKWKAKIDKTCFEQNICLIITKCIMIVINKNVRGKQFELNRMFHFEIKHKQSNDWFKNYCNQNMIFMDNNELLTSFKILKLN